MEESTYLQSFLSEVCDFATSICNSSAANILASNSDGADDIEVTTSG